MISHEHGRSMATQLYPAEHPEFARPKFTRRPVPFPWLAQRDRAETTLFYGQNQQEVKPYILYPFNDMLTSCEISL